MMTSDWTRKFFLVWLVCELVALFPVNGGKLHAQSVRLSIREALLRVEQNLPLLEAYRRQASAASENIALARNGMIPELTAGYQVNVSTFNNITGTNYPGFLVPISGPPSAGNEWNFIPGTAVGALLKWNPFTFGQRQAAVEKAAAQYRRVNAAYSEQLFQYQYLALSIYLEAIYLKQVNRIAAAVIERYRANLDQSRVLANEGLIPGIDTSQFLAAMSEAEIEKLKQEKTYVQKISDLSRLTGLTDTDSTIVLTDTVFGKAVYRADAFVMDQHPMYQSIESQKRLTAAGLKEVKRAWVPELDILGSLYGRGSGVDANGTVNKSEGWGISRTNAGIGLQLSFPILQFSRVNIRKRQYGFLLKSDEARLAQARLDISKQIERAEIEYRHDERIAAKTPAQEKIASEVYDGLKRSYEAGLIDYTRLYQAQYELTKAEINNLTAHLQLWRSMLATAVAKGSLNLFLDSIN